MNRTFQYRSAHDIETNSGSYEVRLDGLSATPTIGPAEPSLVSVAITVMHPGPILSINPLAARY